MGYMKNGHGGADSAVRGKPGPFRTRLNKLTLGENTKALHESFGSALG